MKLNEQDLQLWRVKNHEINAQGTAKKYREHIVAWNRRWLVKLGLVKKKGK